MEKMVKIFNKITKQNTIYNKILYESKGKTQENYKLAVQDFSILQSSMKQKTIQSITSKFKRQRQAEFILSALLLVDYLQTVDPEICLANCYQPKLLTSNRKESKYKKINVAQQQFIQFYFGYLKQISLKCQKQIDFVKCSLEQYGQYCQAALKLIFQVLKIDFIIDFCIKNSTQIKLIKLCCGTIFERISYDIRIVHKFLDKWLHLAATDAKEAFMINQIYEKTIYVNKSINKLKVITRQLPRDIKLNIYSVDKELNNTIQKNMYNKQSLRKQYYSSKKIIIMKTTGDEQDFQPAQGDSIMRFTQFI